MPPQNNSIYNEAQSPSLRDAISRKGPTNANINSSLVKRANSVQPYLSNPSTYLTN
jgi:hypothetical protein